MTAVDVGAGDWRTIAEASAAILAREVSPVELTAACLRRIEAIDGELHSYVAILAESAMAAARDAEAAIMAGRPRGPLHGIPIGLKDIIETANVATTGHSHVMRDHVPAADAAVAARLADAGTILLGKLATHEFAFGGPSFDLPFPLPRNPWDRERFAGGSSSGSAVATAAGLALGAIGSDTGGSIRTPSALCGTAGLKPSYGRVSRRGVFPLAFSLDHVGPIAWTVRDCTMLLQAIAGHDPRDPGSVRADVPDYVAALGGDLAGVRIGVLRDWYEGQSHVHPEVAAGMDAAVTVFEDLGARIETTRLPPLEDYQACCVVLILAEAFAVHEPALKTRWQDFGEVFRRRVMPGALLSAADYIQAARQRRHLAAAVERAFETCDLLLLPSAAGPAPLIAQVNPLEMIEKPSFTRPANVSGHPALSVCCGFSREGLPIGLQLIGRMFGEAELLRAGDAYERATPWRRRRPPC